MSGTWYFAYGAVANEAATKPLPPGSFYTEPGAVAHFTLTKAEPVVAYITGIGPTDTVYLSTTNQAANRVGRRTGRFCTKLYMITL